MLLMMPGLAHGQQSNFDLINSARKGNKEALQQMTAMGQSGDVRIQYALGLMYARGEGVPKDSAAAAIWYTQAAEQGFAAAENNLGKMYAEGEGMPKSL